MIRAALIGQCLLAISLFFARTVDALDTVSTKHIATEIQQRLEQTLFLVPLERQAEFALMLYRTTGNKAFLETALVGLYLSADRLQRFSRGLRNANDRKRLIEQESLALPSSLNKPHSDYLFYAFLVLPELNRIAQFSMTLKGDIGEKYNQHMNSFDFKTGLENPEFIAVSAPELAEQVYFLLNLDYGDYRSVYINALQKHYPDDKDELLPTEQLHNKWTAMTHLVIAASDQLQEPVNDPLLKWVPEYFLEHASLVFNRGIPEILAKIGVMLQLTGNQDQEFLKRIQVQLAKLPIPENIGASEFWIMLLLGWVEQYYPVPALYMMPDFRNKTPYMLKPVQ